MAIKAVVFDIGGILEMGPATGWAEKWEQYLNFTPGQLSEKMHHTWSAGAIGSISLAEVHAQTADILGLSALQVNNLMNDMWSEYLGSLNQELYDYFISLRAYYQTAILSNSFVGAREKEQELYGFEDNCDFIIYSHEVGMSKPDQRIYALTCKRLGCEPQEVVFLDDAQININAACSYGMYGILFEDNTQAILDIETLLHREAGRH